MSSISKLSIVAIAIALMSAGTSGVALWRTYHPTSSPRDGSATSTSDQTTTTTPLVVVPSAAGLNAFAAALALQAVGLESKVTLVPSVTVPKNHVVEQRPIEGTSVPEGTVIELFVSSGPP